MSLIKIKNDEETDTKQGNRVAIGPGDYIVISSGDNADDYTFTDVSGDLNERFIADPIQVEVIE